MAYRMYIGIVAIGALACRPNDANGRSDTAGAPETASATVSAAAPIPDSSAGAVAPTVTPGDTAGVRRDTATAAPPASTSSRRARQSSDSARRTGTGDVKTAQRETTAARPLPVGGKRPPRPAPTPLPAPDTTPSSRPATPPETTTTRKDSVQQQGGDKLAVNQSEYNGWKTFAVNCTRCHGEDAVGSTIAPNLMKSLREHVDHELFVQTVKNGRPDKGMPTWGPLLTDKQIEDLYAYLKARSEGRLAPGRPHLKPEG
ncbi:MAG TPA: cytochrome c [Gemmatimonadaceae bacterium]|nr:cytochrome c [Gemmatimonadaceae bacterium]